MTPPRNTEGLTPRSALAWDGSMFAPGESLEEKYRTALLMAAALLETYPHIDMDAWLRHKQGAMN